MFSIIIPCQKFNPYLQECLEYILKQDYTNFEIIVLPDEHVETRQCLVSRDIDFTKIKIIPTDLVLPGEKRNLGAQNAQGEILAFIDDDAYPRKDWLKNAAKYFADKKIAAIGGPGVTPANDSFWQQVSGAVYLSWFSGANPNRFWPIYKRIMNYESRIMNYEVVDDWPSMNFFIRKKDFLAARGFDEKYWPGEDTVLCNNLIKADKKILYCPDVLVYHHRRKNLAEHLKQVGNYKRGVYVRLHPENSKKLKYFLPSLFLIFILCGWLILFLPRPWNLIYPALWAVYLLALLTALTQIFWRTKKLVVSLASVLYIIPTHLWYGWGFLKGILSKRA